jgi:hypothetical protein
MKSSKLFILILAGIVVAAPAFASPFATEVVSATGTFGSSPYDDPDAVLGKPTTWIKGSDVGGVDMAASMSNPMG